MDIEKKQNDEREGALREADVAVRKAYLELENAVSSLLRFEEVMYEHQGLLRGIGRARKALREALHIE